MTDPAAESWPPPAEYVDRLRRFAVYLRDLMEHSRDLKRAGRPVEATESVEALSGPVRAVEEMIRAVDAGDRAAYERARQQPGSKTPPLAGQLGDTRDASPGQD